MTTVGQRERITQDRVVARFQTHLGYDYLGNWEDREINGNIEKTILHQYLLKKGYSNSLIIKAIHELDRVATNQSKSLYDLNKDVYSLLRYGVKVKEEVGENTRTVKLIDWDNPLENQFAIAEEVTVKGENDKRPDVVLYVNGIALGVLELKRSTVSVSEGIRQNLDNQKQTFIRSFFATIQLIMAGNDTEGIRYGVIETPEKYWLSWKEKSDIENALLIGTLLSYAVKSGFWSSCTILSSTTVAPKRSAGTINTLQSRHLRQAYANMKAVLSGTPRVVAKA
jgi:type I restriction enzyme R subunit